MNYAILRRSNKNPLKWRQCQLSTDYTESPIVQTSSEEVARARRNFLAEKFPKYYYIVVEAPE